MSKVALKSQFNQPLTYQLIEALGKKEIRLNPELYAILDTTIKIGLGAAISGLSAYYLSRNNFENERKKKNRESIQSLLLEAATKLEKANHKLEESGHPLWEHVVDKSIIGSNEAVKKCLKMRMEAASLIYEVKAIMALLGLNAASDLLNQIVAKLDSTYQSIALHGAFEMASNVNYEMEGVKALVKEVLNLVSAEYFKA